MAQKVRPPLGLYVDGRRRNIITILPVRLMWEPVRDLQESEHDAAVDLHSHVRKMNQCGNFIP
eukprot:scaffold2256_cov166-Amphora_coffeaeformis.AAC.3